jgi:hypothetical protein
MATEASVFTGQREATTCACVRGAGRGKEAEEEPTGTASLLSLCDELNLQHNANAVGGGDRGRLEFVTELRLRLYRLFLV